MAGVVIHLERAVQRDKPTLVGFAAVNYTTIEIIGNIQQNVSSVIHTVRHARGLSLASVSHALCWQD